MIAFANFSSEPMGVEIISCPRMVAVIWEATFRISYSSSDNRSKRAHTAGRTGEGFVGFRKASCKTGEKLSSECSAARRVDSGRRDCEEVDNTSKYLQSSFSSTDPFKKSYY